MKWSVSPRTEFRVLHRKTVEFFPEERKPAKVVSHTVVVVVVVVSPLQRGC